MTGESSRLVSELRSTLGKMEAALSVVSDAIAWIEPDGNVGWCNEALPRILGRPYLEVVGRRLSSLLALERFGKAVGLEAHPARLVFQTRAAGSGIYEFRGLNGAPLDLEILWSPLELATGESVGVICVRDITERRQAERRIESSERMFLQSQKMEAIGRLAGGVAHDFNNILTVILGYCKLMQEDPRFRDAASDDLAEVVHAAQRAAALTRQLLAFSRKQVLTPLVLDLNAVITDIEKMLRRLIEEDIDLELHLAPDLKRIKVDPGQVEQVLMNLAINARDAMPSGGTLLLETANIAFDEHSLGRHDIIPPGSYVMLAVSDTGYGMDEATKSHLFEPFFTTKEKGKGTGLGLSTIYGIVKQSGGYIWVYSETGKGSVFKIYLPSTEEAVEPIGRKAAGAASVKGSETVLLIEDDAAVRTMLSRALRLNGYRVIEAGNGGEGLQAYESGSNEIQLVVTDVVMPGIGGKVLGDRIKSLRPDARIIYMSGYTDEAILRHGQFGPGTVFLQKPLTPHAFLSKVRQVLDEKRSAKDALPGP